MVWSPSIRSSSVRVAEFARSARSPSPLRSGPPVVFSCSSGFRRRRPPVPTKWVSEECLCVQRTNPVPIATHPGRGIRCLDSDRLSFDGEALLHLVGDDRDVFAQDADLHLAQVELVGVPATCLQLVCKRFLRVAPDALRP